MRPRAKSFLTDKKDYFASVITFIIIIGHLEIYRGKRKGFSWHTLILCFQSIPSAIAIKMNFMVMLKWKIQSFVVHWICDTYDGKDSNLIKLNPLHLIWLSRLLLDCWAEESEAGHIGQRIASCPKDCIWKCPWWSLSLNSVTLEMPQEGMMCWWWPWPLVGIYVSLMNIFFVIIILRLSECM